MSYRTTHRDGKPIYRIIRWVMGKKIESVGLKLLVWGPLGLVTVIWLGLIGYHVFVVLDVVGKAVAMGASTNEKTSAKKPVPQTQSFISEAVALRYEGHK